MLFLGVLMFSLLYLLVVALILIFNFKAYNSVDCIIYEILFQDSREDNSCPRKIELSLRALKTPDLKQCHSYTHHTHTHIKKKFLNTQSGTHLREPSRDDETESGI